jgi:hypothetical protein
VLDTNDIIEIEERWPDVAQEDAEVPPAIRELKQLGLVRPVEEDSCDSDAVKATPGSSRCL